MGTVGFTPVTTRISIALLHGALAIAMAGCGESPSNAKSAAPVRAVHEVALSTQGDAISPRTNVSSVAPSETAPFRTEIPNPPESTDKQPSSSKKSKANIAKMFRPPVSVKENAAIVEPDLPEPAKESPVVALPTVRVLGFGRTEKPYAILEVDGQTHVTGVGENVGGVSIAAIENDAVSFSFHGMSWTTRLFDQPWKSEQKSRPPAPKRTLTRTSVVSAPPPSVTEPAPRIAPGPPPLPSVPGLSKPPSTPKESGNMLFPPLPNLNSQGAPNSFVPPFNPGPPAGVSVSGS